MKDRIDLFPVGWYNLQSAVDILAFKEYVRK